MRPAGVQKSEEAIAAGTVLLTARELAPRIGLGDSVRSASKVRSRARLGQIPSYRPNSKVYLFHWPTVISAISNLKTKPVGRSR